MDCSAFRRYHVAFVDDTLPGDLLVAAVRHVAECAECARHDAAVRRSLLLARNICGQRPLECSPDFAARLEARLRQEGGRDLTDRVGLPAADWTPSWREVVAESATRVVGRLPAHRRARQALATAAVLAVASTGALLRGEERPMQLQGLGSGPLAAAAFGSPFAPATEDFGVAGEAGFGGGFRAAGAPGLVTAEQSPPDDAATFVVYDGAVDAGALVAPASLGVPVWAAAVLAGEVPAVLWRAEDGSTVHVVRVGR